MIKFRGYSIGIAQIDDEIEEKLNFRNLANFYYQLIGQ